MILTLVEKNLDGSAVEVSLEALTFARNLSAEGGGVPVDAVVVASMGRASPTSCARSWRRTASAPSTRSGATASSSYSGCRLGLCDPLRARADASRSS